MTDVAAWLVSRFATVVPGSSIGLPHCEVNQHMGIEAGHDVDDPLAVAGLDQVELAAAQAPPGRVDVNAQDRAHPGLGFEQ